MNLRICRTKKIITDLAAVKSQIAMDGADLNVGGAEACRGLPNCLEKL